MLFWSDIYKWDNLLPAFIDPLLVPPCSYPLLAATKSNPWTPEVCIAQYTSRKQLHVCPSRAKPCLSNEGKALPPLLFCRSSNVWEELKYFFTGHEKSQWPKSPTASRKRFNLIQKKAVFGPVPCLSVRYREGSKRETPSSVTAGEFWMLMPTLPGPGGILMSYS